MDEWLIFSGSGQPHDGIDRLPDPPPWRAFRGGPTVPLERDAVGSHAHRHAGSVAYRSDQHIVDAVNTALYLRRPLLVTGPPGTGKSTLAFAVSHELRLGPVLRWPVTSRTTLQDGLYRYDAISRIEDSNLERRSDQTAEDQPPRLSIGQYLQLGPLGTSLVPFDIPRVLLIDEIDKGDIDLPNDLLNVLEEGEFEVRELARIADQTPIVPIRPFDDLAPIPIHRGRIQCRAFPFVVLTSNGERDFSPAFLRRCVRLDLTKPDSTKLEAIVTAHLGPSVAETAIPLITAFLQRRSHGELATDQLLNAIYLAQYAHGTRIIDYPELLDIVLHSLTVVE